MRALIIMLGLLAVMGLVGKYEYRHAVQDLERSYVIATQSTLHWIKDGGE